MTGGVCHRGNQAGLYRHRHPDGLGGHTGRGEEDHLAPHGTNINREGELASQGYIHPPDTGLNVYRYQLWTFLLCSV